MNLTTDMRDSFTWNTRQIYLWLTATYETEEHELNQAVFWNWIIESQVGVPVEIQRFNVKSNWSCTSTCLPDHPLYVLHFLQTMQDAKQHI